MGRIERYTKIFDKKAVNGVGITVPVKDFEHITVMVSTSNGSTLTFECVGAVGTGILGVTAPNFSSTASFTNPYFNVNMVDLNNRDSIVGSDGVTISSESIIRGYSINISGLDFLNFKLNGYMTGKLTILSRAYNNS